MLKENYYVKLNKSSCCVGGKTKQTLQEVLQKKTFKPNIDNTNRNTIKLNLKTAE